MSKTKAAVREKTKATNKHRSNIQRHQRNSERLY